MGLKIKVVDSGSNKNLASPDSQLTFKNKSTILPKFDEYLLNKQIIYHFQNSRVVNLSGIWGLSGILLFSLPVFCVFDIFPSSPEIT